MSFSIYVVDTETTGLSFDIHDVIEISMFRMIDGDQKTWHVKPMNEESIDKKALEVNGHKFEDITHKTQEGKNKYLDPKIIIPDIENWMMMDCFAPEDRIIVGQNINFDISMLKNMWKKCNSLSTFPFGSRPLSIDTMQVELLLNICNEEKNKFYNLSSLVEKYGVKKDKAHTADGDVRMTVELFKKQISALKNNADAKNIIRSRK